MKLMNLFIALVFIGSSVWAQYADEANVPCKPLAEMATHYKQLAKSAERASASEWDVHYYDLSIDIDIQNRLIYGSVEVHFKAITDSLDRVILDLDNNLNVDSVYINGSNYSHRVNSLEVILDRAYSAGETVVVGVSYFGLPQVSGFQAFKFGTQNDIVGGIPMVSTLSEPYGARMWWPCKDVPTDKADSVRIVVTVDDKLTAVANGMLISEFDNEDGTKTWVWEHKYPIATYLVSLAITEYDYWSDTFFFADGDSMPLEYWMYPNYATSSNIARWNLTGNMIEIFNEAYGEYPFAREKYGMAQFGWGGAMEHQTCSSMGSSGENTIAHELAHQWWGDLVTCTNFHHIWINEGFATYSEALYWGAKYGEAAYHSHMATKDTDYVGSIYRTDLSDVWSIFDYIVYGKGAWTLHMLRHILGDDAFFETLALFRETYKNSHASTEDFRGVAELVYGEDLGWFFTQWIYADGKPNYHWAWYAYNADASGNSEIILHVEQTQIKPSPLYKMPIDIYLKGDDRDTTIVVWNSERTTGYTFQLDFKPTSVEFDPEKWIHKKATMLTGIEDFGPQPGSFVLMDAYPNPFNATVTIPYVVNGYFQGQLDIYNLNGSVVYSQKLSHDDSGAYEVNWYAKDEHGTSLPSGLYIAKISSSTQLAFSQKITLLK